MHETDRGTSPECVYQLSAQSNNKNLFYNVLNNVIEV